jgi:alkaline phosphatase D
MRLLSLLLLLVSAPLLAQTALLRSGPMVGSCEMREVTLWVQTIHPATVQVRYWERENSARRFLTRTVSTVAERANVAHLVADSVEPGRRYAYEVIVDGSVVPRPYPLEFQTPGLWQWREEPPPFTLAVGSCAYVNETEVDRPGTPYGAGYEIFSAIHARRPDVMLWLGDNTYLREVDWYSWSGILRRYTHTRSLPEMQPLLASTSHYAIWDDHDFGPNNSDRGWREKESSLEAFKLFWANPSYGTDEVRGIFSAFEWNDVEVFLLDNRYHRSPNRRTTGDRAMFGEAQLRTLVDRLVSSQATFKLVATGGQVLNPVAGSENYAGWPEERGRLLDAIAAERITGVVFLSGDRHMTELTAMPRAGTYPLYDLTVSPLTAGPYAKGAEEKNTLRVEGTFVGEHNFAVLSFSGSRKERVMTITIHDRSGAAKWTREIKASELR